MHNLSIRYYAMYMYDYMIIYLRIDLTSSEFGASQLTSRPGARQRGKFCHKRASIWPFRMIFSKKIFVHIKLSLFEYVCALKK